MSFERDLHRGKIGEELAKKIFRQRGIEVKDVSDSQEYQKKDIDLIAGDGITYEVKTDYRYSQTGNLALEIKVSTSLGERDGWLYGTDAERIIFVNPAKMNGIVIIDTAELRSLVETGALRTAYCYDSPTKTVELRLLPYKEYEDAFERMALRQE